MVRKKSEDLVVIALGIALCYFIYFEVMKELPHTY